MPIDWSDFAVNSKIKIIQILYTLLSLLNFRKQNTWISSMPKKSKQKVKNQKPMADLNPEYSYANLAH